MSEKRRIKRKPTRREFRKRAKNIRASNTIYVTILVGAIIAIVLWRYSTISELEYGNAALADQRDKLEIMRNDLSNKIEEINDSDWLKTQAEERINMRDAQKNQIVKIDMSPESKENIVIRFFKDLFR